MSTTSVANAKNQIDAYYLLFGHEEQPFCNCMNFSKNNVGNLLSSSALDMGI